MIATAPALRPGAAKHAATLASTHAATLAQWVRSRPAEERASSKSLHIAAERALSPVEWGESRFYIPTDTGRPRLIKFLPHQKIIFELFFNQAIAAYHDCEPNFQTLVFSTVKKSGKALSLDTPLPTPTGWTTMGAVKVGDTLFDADGKQTRVTYVTDVQHDKQCYRVTLSDGASVVADAEHNWVVEALPKYKTETLTTEHLLENLRRKDGAANYRIRNTSPVATDTAEVSIPPYVLGAWLGDGNSANGVITCSDEDVFVVDEIMREGEFLVEKASFDSFKTPQYSISSETHGGGPAKHASSLTVRLKKLNLLKNKHIPTAYLRASREQRIALLQGLMDTDGYINEAKYGEYEISQKNERLAKDIVELLRSLGVCPTLSDDVSKLYGVTAGRRHRIRFHAPTFDVFRLPRKLAVQKRDEVFRSRQTDRSRCRRVVSITPTNSVPVKCIQVDSPTSTYLCGEGMIPTHNTALAALVARWITETWGSHAEVYCLANDKEQARGRIYQAALSSIELDPRYDRKAKGIEDYWRIIEREARHLPTNGVMKAVSVDYKGEAGSNPVATLWSELWGYSLESHKRLWEELTPVPTRPRSIRYVETYAGYDGESGILNALEDKMRTDSASLRLTHKHLEDINNACGTSLQWPWPDQELPFYLHVPSRTFAYWDDGEQARRMPWQTPRYYQGQGDLRPNAFNRLHLNFRVSNAEQFIDIQWFDRLKIEPLPLDHKTPIVIGADASVTGDCCALSVVSRDTRGRDKHDDVLHRMGRIWTPSAGHPMDYSVTIEPMLRVWCTGHNHPKREKCESHSLLQRIGPCPKAQPYNVVEIAYDEFQLHDMMTRLRNDSVAWCRKFGQQADRSVADKALFDLIRDQRLHHFGDPDLREHIRNCGAKIPEGDNSRLRLIKKADNSKIDYAVATSMASYEVLRLNL